MIMVGYVINAKCINHGIYLLTVKLDSKNIPECVRNAGTPTIESLEKRLIMNEIGNTS